MDKVTSIDEYIESFPAEIQAVLIDVRETVRAAAPDATEKIGYGMPAFELQGYLLYFAANKAHIGFYPMPEALENFKDEFDKAGYKSSKGAVQFPLDKPMPLDLIRRITEYRVAQNLANAKAKAEKKKKGKAKD
jgi:uncharacterized protein YdhG (YjbR/CyaY superfamily)